MSRERRRETRRARGRWAREEERRKTEDGLVGGFASDPCWQMVPALAAGEDRVIGWDFWVDLGRSRFGSLEVYYVMMDGRTSLGGTPAIWNLMGPDCRLQRLPRVAGACLAGVGACSPL